MPILSVDFADTEGRLWWSEFGVSCAYRDAAGQPIYYQGYQAVTWDTAPACDFAANSTNAMADAEGGCMDVSRFSCPWQQ